MKRTLATAGHPALAAAPRLRAACDAGSAHAAYSWSVNPSINPVHQTATAMDVFDTSKPARRPEELSP